MRGERATLGKSLLDVQRELRIKANYIAAIENCDPEAFDTPGFIAGYVRSYSRYLGMDPDSTYAKFCAESGFITAHGMSADASSRRQETLVPQKKTAPKDPFITPTTPFIPAGESMFARIEPAAIGSGLVLLALIGGLAYGGYAVLNEVQRVQFAPVENTPDVLADLDPLAGATRVVDDPVTQSGASASGVFTPPRNSMDRLYRPKALDVPVVVSRDAPISTLNPASVGTFMADAGNTRSDLPGMSQNESSEDRAVAEALGVENGSSTPVNMPQVIAAAKPGVSLVAVRPAWVRVQSQDGTILFEKILDAGESYDLPKTEDAPVLRAGMSGSLYFQVDGSFYGPAGKGTNAIRNVGLAADDLKTSFALADLTLDPEAERVISVAQADLPQID